MRWAASVVETLAIWEIHMDPMPNTVLLREMGADLKGRWTDVYNDTLRDNLQLRVYRAARWIEQAEKTDSDDAAFIFY